MLTAIKLTDEQLERIRVVLKDLGVSQAHCWTGPTSMPGGEIVISYRLKEGLPETARDFNALGKALDQVVEPDTLGFPKFGCGLRPDEFYSVYRDQTFFDFTEDGECMRKIMEYYKIEYAGQEMVRVADMIDFVPFSYSDSEPVELPTAPESSTLLSET